MLTMACWQSCLSLLLVCCAVYQGFAAPAEIINFLTITPPEGQTTAVPCIHLPCPAVPFPDLCTRIKTTYFEWHGQLCKGCDFCIVDTTPETK